MTWWTLGIGLAIIAVAVLLALFVHVGETDRCTHGVPLDRACERCDEAAYCSPCGGPCFDEGHADDWRLP